MWVLTIYCFSMCLLSKVAPVGIGLCMFIMCWELVHGNTITWNSDYSCTGDVDTTTISLLWYLIWLWGLCLYILTHQCHQIDCIDIIGEFMCIESYKKFLFSLSVLPVNFNKYWSKGKRSNCTASELYELHAYCLYCLWTKFYYEQQGCFCTATWVYYCTSSWRYPRTTSCKECFVWVLFLLQVPVRNVGAYTGTCNKKSTQSQQSPIEVELEVPPLNYLTYMHIIFIAFEVYTCVDPPA